MHIPIKRLEGREHYVIPTVMLQVGTWDGSVGPVYYTANSLHASVKSWNGRPIVIHHPDMYRYGLAQHPEVFDRQRVGTIFNTSFDGHRLMCDSWLDRKRLRRLAPEVEHAVLNKRMFEVSTGLEFDGEHNGEVIVTNRLYPDHLAILPGKRGACSCQDGCGLVRNRSRHYARV